MSKLDKTNKKYPKCLNCTYTGCDDELKKIGQTSMCAVDAYDGKYKKSEDTNVKT